MDRISIGRRIVSAARHLRMLRNRCLVDAGCTIGGAYFHVFMFFAKNDGCTEKQAAAAIGKDKTYVTKAVKKLGAQGMVLSRRDDNDARFKRIHLTAQGRTELSKAKQALGRINGIVSGGIDEKSTDAFLDTLMHMQTNITTYLGLE